MSTLESDYALAVQTVRKFNNASCNHLQRKLHWSFDRASLAIDQMEDQFIVGPMSTSGKRDVLPPCVHELWKKVQLQKNEIDALKMGVVLKDHEKRALFETIYAEAEEGVIPTVCEFSIDSGKYVSSNKTNIPEAVISLAVGVKNTCYNFFIKGWDESKAHNTGVPEGYVLLPKTPTALTDEVLGLMPHQLPIPAIAEMLRKSGVDLPRKIEKEQSYILLKILVTALEHGDQWRSVFADEMKAINAMSEDKQP